jgi:hypothetical protein
VEQSSTKIYATFSVLKKPSKEKSPFNRRKFAQSEVDNIITIFWEQMAFFKKQQQCNYQIFAWFNFALRSKLRILRQFFCAKIF